MMNMTIDTTVAAVIFKMIEEEAADGRALDLTYLLRVTNLKQSMAVKVTAAFHRLLAEKLIVEINHNLFTLAAKEKKMTVKRPEILPPDVATAVMNAVDYHIGDGLAPDDTGPINRIVSIVKEAEATLLITFDDGSQFQAAVIMVKGPEV